MAVRTWSWRAVDAFLAFNVLLFLGMCWFTYYDRFIAYRGAGNVQEFFVYACAILVAMVIAWGGLRRWPLPTWLLLLVQTGVLLHFAGAFFPIDGGRLYDATLASLRYDKFVHAFNAFAGAALLSYLLDATGSRIAFRSLIVVLAVLGAGAFVEIVEFGVTLTIPHNGVGTYGNNMGDMIANLSGALVHEGVLRLRALLGRIRVDAGTATMTEPVTG